MLANESIVVAESKVSIVNNVETKMKDAFDCIFLNILKRIRFFFDPQLHQKFYFCIG
jgi:hypothetical protein